MGFSNQFGGLKQRSTAHALVSIKGVASMSVMYTVLSSLAAGGRLGVAAAGVLFWHAASWHATSIARVARRRDASRLVS